jgi:hypothetical protein
MAHDSYLLFNDDGGFAITGTSSPLDGAERQTRPPTPHYAENHRRNQ